MTIALQANPGSGVLSGTLTQAAVAGVATFNDLSLDKAANGYTLRVTSGALTAATSVTFNVSAGTATTLAFVTQPVSVLQGAPIAPPVAVAVQDGFGNTVPSAANNITMSIGTNPNAGTLSGTLTVAASGGVATFSDLHIDNPGTGYTLQAAAGGFTAVVSAAFNVLPSGAGIAWINAAGGNWSNPANWSPARVPAKGDTVFITLGGSYTVTLDVNDTVAFLTVGGGAPTLTASSRTLGVDSGGSVAAGATVTLTNSTLNGTGILASQGTLNLQNTTVNSGLSNLGLLVARSGTTLNGPFTTGPVSTLRVEGDASCCSAAVTVANGFTNNGTIDLTAINGASGTSAVLTVTNGSLTNAAGAHINSLPGTGGARTLTAQLANQGTLTVSQPLTINHGSAAHTNSGTVALAANLTLNQSGVSPSFTHSGTLTIQAGDTLILNSGAFNYAGGAIGGLGAITFSSVTLALTPNLTNDTLTLSFTNSTVNGPGTLANAATRTLFAQNTTFNGPVDNQGVLRARAGTTFNGSLTTSASSTLRVEGDASCCSAFVTVTNGFTNNGTIDLTAINGASGTSAALTVTNGSLTNAPGGHINSLPGTGGARTLTAQLANQGTVTVSAPLTINHGSAAHTNSGTIALAANLTLNQSGVSPSFTHSGTLAIPAGDTLILNSGAFSYTGGTIGGLGAITFSSVTLALTPDLVNDTLTLSFTNSTVNGPGTLANAATRTLFAQNTDFNGPVNNQGVLQARSGTTFNGSLTTSAASTLRVEGDAACCAAFVTVTNGFTNNGTIDLTAINGASGTSAALTVTNGSLTNATGAHINSLPGTGGARTLTAQLANQGTVTVSAPLTINHGSAAHTNSGTIALAANLTLNQSGVSPSFTHSGTLTIPAGDTLILNSGAFNYTGGTIGGLGAITFSSVTLALTPDLVNDTLSLSFTNSTVNGPGTLGNAATRTLFAQNTTFNGPVVNQGVLRARSSTVFTGSLTTSVGSTLRVEGDAACCAAFVTVANGFTNNGAIDLTAINGASGTSAGLTVTSGSLTNAAGASINSLAGTGGSRTLTAQLVNLGTLAVSQPLTINHGSAAHTNSGTITVAANLTVNQSGITPSFTNGGAISVGTGDTLTITSGAFTQNAGTLGGAGALALSSVNPAAFNTAHSLGSIILLNATVSFSTAQSTAATQWGITNSTVNGPITFTNNAGRSLTVQGATYNTAFDNQGALTLRASSSLTGTVTTGGASSLVVQGDAACCAAFATIANGFTNNGTIDLTAINGTSGTTAQLTVTSGTLTNAPGAIITSSAGTGGARTLAVALNNLGTLTVAQPLTMNLSAAVHTNGSTGVINITGGDLTLNQGGAGPSFTNLGTVNLPSGRTWTVTGGAWTHSGPALGSGGALVLSSVSPAAFNTAHTLGAITLTNTTASFALDQSTATTAFTLTNSTVNGPGTLTNAAGKNLFVQGGVLNTALINQNLVTLRGSVTINDTIITAPSSTLRIEGDAACCAAFVRVDSAFTNNGTIELTAVNGAGTTASLTVDSGIVVNAGTIDVLPGNGGARALNVSLNNQGTMIVSQALTMNKSAASVVNASTGAIQLAGGDLTVTLSGFRPAISNFGTINVGTNKMVVSGTGGFTNQSAGTLMGSGTFDVATPNISFITNGTTIVGASPGVGTLNWVGTYLQGPDPSVFQVDVGGLGTKPGVDYDQFVGTDNVTLQGGTLNVNLTGPVSGQTYVIMQLPAGKTFSGDFQVKNIDPVPKCVVGPSGNQYLIVCP
ncbi:MAG: beta strand repeat-containing protein [Gemmatimonadota bacterium]